MYIYVHTHIYIYTHICTCTYTFTCKYVHSYTHIHTCKYTHRSPPHDRLHNRREVIIHNDNVRRLLRDSSACDAHRQAHIRFLQSRRIVCAITRHGNNLPHSFQALNDGQLVLRYQRESPSFFLVPPSFL